MTAPVTAPPGGPAVRSPRREIPRQVTAHERFGRNRP